MLVCEMSFLFMLGCMKLILNLLVSMLGFSVSVLMKVSEILVMVDISLLCVKLWCWCRFLCSGMCKVVCEGVMLVNWVLIRVEKDCVVII